MKIETINNFNSDNIDELKEWIETLNLSGSTPRGQKKNKEHLVFIKNQLKMIEMFGDSELTINNISATLAHLSQEDINTINQKFADSEKGIFKTKNIEVINRSRMSEKAFNEFSIEISKMINSLTGFHKLASVDGVKIVIVNKSEQKSPGKYKSNLDEIWVQPNLKVDNELYGHGKFIIMHELGHRFDHKYGLPEGFSDHQFYTTDYSRKLVDFGASECFAEIFAVSKKEWTERYSEYKDEVDRFSELMLNYTKDIKPKKQFKVKGLEWV